VKPRPATARREVQHATEDSDGSETLCGFYLYRKPHPRVNNAEPTCLRCLRVIRSRCFDHGVRKCKLCPPGWYVLGGNP
jgi:hypothetical protein